MIPRGPTQITSPYQNNGQAQKNSMLDKLKLFKNNEKPAPVSNGKRTSSSSGVSSARSERSDSSASLEPNVEIKPVRNTSRLKQTRTNKPNQSKNSPNATKKEISTNKPNKIAVEVEKHAHKVASLPATKITEPKIKVTINKDGTTKTQSHIPSIPTLQTGPGTAIPKPTAAIKGTSKLTRDTSTSSFKVPNSAGISRESSQMSLKQHKPTVAMVSPIKNEKDLAHLSESSNSASTGQHSNSSESSVIYKPSSESGSEHHNIIPNRKEPLNYITDVTELSPPPPAPQTPKEFPKKLEEVTQNSNSEKNIKTMTYQNNINAKENKVLISEENGSNKLTHIKNATTEEKDDNSLIIEPMKPLIRGYCSTLTLPSRHRHYQRIQPDGGSDYCEISLANGYLSDGEILRNPVAMDIGDGYMSEGGSILYNRRLQTMPAHIPNG